MRRQQAAIWLCATSIFFATIPATAGDKIEIDWELRYPFRLFAEYPQDVIGDFRDDKRAEWTDSWAGRRNLYVHPDCMKAEGPVLCSEQKIGPLRVQAMRDAFKPEAQPGINSVIGPRLIDRGLRYDWEERVHYLDKSQGGPIVVKKGGDPGTDPAHPVWLSLKSDTLDRAEIAKWTCRWIVDGGTPVEGSCGATKHNFKRTEDASKTSKVSVEVINRVDQHIEPISGPTTLVKEMVIVALGDSFASGEGNPDIPVQMSKEMSKASDPKRRWPVRMGSGDGTKEVNHAAMWMDRNCHRSLNSPQARAVIQLSAKYPKREIAFIGVACSGAELLEGVLGTYAGTKEISGTIEAKMKAEPWRYQMSQINQVLWPLCADPEIDASLSKDDAYKAAILNGLPNGATAARITCKGGLKRPVDAVLLSVGGNDVGFARVILRLLIKGWANYAGLIPEGAACLIKHDCSAGWKTFSPKKCQFLGGAQKTRCLNELEQPLAAKYELLGKTIRNELKVASKDRIIFAQYPDPTLSEKGVTCGGGDKFWSSGLERWPGRTMVRPRNALQPLTNPAPDDLTSISKGDLQKVSKTFIGAIQAAIEKSGTEGHWQVANGHVESFKKHGLCARSGNAKPPPEDDPSLAAFRKSSGPAFDAYAATGRWMRNVNDAYMAQNTHPLTVSTNANAFSSAAIKTRLMETFGAFHPNALGAAAIADSYYQSLDAIIKKEAP